MTITGWEALAAHIRAHPIDGTPSDRRKAFDALTPPGARGSTCVLGGVPCVVIEGSERETPIIWVHGGGLVFGSPRSHAAVANALAERTRRSIIMPDYRLAPEHRWPAPLDDVLAVIDAVAEPVDLTGDSAGGQVALIAALRRPGRVRRLALLSPNTDRTGLSQTRAPHSSIDIMNDDGTDRALAEYSFGSDIAEHPDASPLLADLTRLPPVWLTVATNEVLLDDSLLLVRRLGLAGVPTDVRIEKGLCHLWMLWPDALPESTATHDALAGFLKAPD